MRKGTRSWLPLEGEGLSNLTVGELTPCLKLLEDALIHWGANPLQVFNDLRSHGGQSEILEEAMRVLLFRWSRRFSRYTVGVNYYLSIDSLIREANLQRPQPLEYFDSTPGKSGQAAIEVVEAFLGKELTPQKAREALYNYFDHSTPADIETLLTFAKRWRPATKRHTVATVLHDDRICILDVVDQRPSVQIEQKPGFWTIEPNWWILAASG